MRPLAKVGLVGAGYIGAFTLASAVVTVYVAATGGPDRQTYGVMFAFGDDLLFLAVFGVAAVVPTGVALFFLRPYRSFWRVLSVTALGVATTAVAAFYDYLASQGPDAHSVASALSALAVLRILIAPLLALAFLVSAVIAPTRSPRLALLVATAMEASVFVCVALIWFTLFNCTDTRGGAMPPTIAFEPDRRRASRAAAGQRARRSNHATSAPSRWSCS